MTSVRDIEPTRVDIFTKHSPERLSLIDLSGRPSCLASRRSIGIPIQGNFAALLGFRQGPAGHACGNYREQTSQRGAGTYQSRTGKGAPIESPRRKTAHQIRTKWPKVPRTALADGTVLRKKTRRAGSPQSQPGLRYMRSPPCQALLPSASNWTFLLCRPRDISTWLQRAVAVTLPQEGGAPCPRSPNPTAFKPSSPLSR